MVKLNDFQGGFFSKWYSTHLSHEKKKLIPFHYTGWLIWILIKVYYNPYVPGKYNPLYNPTNQGFFIAHFFSITSLLQQKTKKVPLTHGPDSHGDGKGIFPDIYLSSLKLTALRTWSPGWLEDFLVSVCDGLFSGAFAVSFREGTTQLVSMG